MRLSILLLKRADDQDIYPADLHPPVEDLLGHYHVTGQYDAVALARVPDEATFDERNRLPLDGTVFTVEVALEIPELPPQIGGIVRW